MSIPASPARSIPGEVLSTSAPAPIPLQRQQNIQFSHIGEESSRTCDMRHRAHGDTDDTKTMKTQHPHETEGM
jgi:hypothetical protein